MYSFLRNFVIVFSLNNYQHLATKNNTKTHEEDFFILAYRSLLVE